MHFRFYRTTIDMYMNKKGLLFFWSLIGEKQYGVNIPNFSITRLTGAATYTSEKGVHMIQPMRKEPS